MKVIEHNYTIYIISWLIISMLLPLFFKSMYRKIQNTDDAQTRNTLFTLTMFTGIPVLIISLIFPLIFIIGDSGMNSLYRYTWAGLYMGFIFYFLIKQRSGKNKKGQKKTVSSKTK